MSQFDITTFDTELNHKILPVKRCRFSFSGESYRFIDIRQNTVLHSKLTLRLLMSYIYMEHLFLMFLDHT